MRHSSVQKHKTANSDSATDIYRSLMDGSHPVHYQIHVDSFPATPSQVHTLLNVSLLSRLVCSPKIQNSQVKPFRRYFDDTHTLKTRTAPVPSVTQSDSLRDYPTLNTVV
jgi:hypothetical protein